MVRARWADQPDVDEVRFTYDEPAAPGPALPPADLGGVQRLLRAFAEGKPPRGTYTSIPDARAAYEYFSRFSNPVQALETIGADLAQAKLGLPDRELAAAERAYFAPMTAANARKAANWVEQNLSEGSLEVLDNKTAEIIDTVDVEARRGAMTAAQAAAHRGDFTPAQKRAATRARNAEELRRQIANENRALQRDFERAQAEQRRQKALEKLTLSLPWERVNTAQAQLKAPLHPVVRAALANNDLQGALRAIPAVYGDSRLGTIARLLADRVQGVNVVLVDPDGPDAPILDPYGRGERSLGVYYPDSLISGGAIALDARDGDSLVTLLHEAAHAATSRAIADPNNPLSRELDQIAAALRPLNIVPDYFLSNRFELLAESMASPSFRSALATVHPNGSVLSAWDRVVQALRNFFRRLLPRPLANQLARVRPSALDSIDSIIDQILDPSMDGVRRTDLVDSALPDALPRVITSFMAQQRAASGPRDGFRQRFVESFNATFWETIPDWGRTIISGLTPLAGLIDVAQYYRIKGAAALAKAIRNTESAAIPFVQRANGVLSRAVRWANANPEQKQVFDELVGFSTVENVNPMLDASAAQKRYGGSFPKMQQYQQARALWNRLNPTGQDIYRAMRDVYRRSYEEMRQALSGEIEALLPNQPELASSVRRSIYSRLFDFNEIDPYFPLYRRGDYWLIFDAIDPKTGQRETVKELYETRGALRMAMASLDNLTAGELVPGSVKTAVRGEFQGAPQLSDLQVVRDILRTLERGNVDPRVQEQVTRRIIDALPETSFAKSLAKRQGVPGFRTNAIEAFRVKGYSTARQAARYLQATKLREQMGIVQEQLSDTALEPSRRQVITELLKRADFALNAPQGVWEDLVNVANRTAFTFTIGGLNISSAVVNMTAVPLVVFPYLAGKYGVRDAQRALFSAAREFSTSGIEHEIDLPTPIDGQSTVVTKGLPSIDNLYILNDRGEFRVREREGMTPELRRRLEERIPLITQAMQEGQLNRSLFYDSMGIEESGRERGLFEKFTAIGGLPFHLAERMNRQVTLMAAYDMELARLRRDPANANVPDLTLQQRAASEALYQAREINGGATLAEAPRWAQRGLGRAAFMFKTYGIQMLYMQLHAAKQIYNPEGATTEESRRIRQIALRRLVGLNASLAFWAGFAGTPIVGALQGVIGGLGLDELLSDDDETPQEIVNRYFGDTLYYGWLSELLGTDLSGRIGLDLVEMLTVGNRYNENPSPEEWLFAALTGPAGSVALQLQRSSSELARAATGDGTGTEDVSRAIEGMVPPIVRNFMRAVRYEGEGVETRRGDAITDHLSVGELAGQVLGFAPADVTRAQTESRNLLRRDRALTNRRNALSRRYYLALRQGNFIEAQDVLAEIREFNADPSTPRAFRIDRDYLRNSIRQHLRTSAEMHNGVTLSPMMRQTIAENLAAQQAGYTLY